MKKLFGTDGMRGLAGEFPLDEQTIFTVGKSLARQFWRTNDAAPLFVTGRDTRESGEWIERAFHAGAGSGGAPCISAGIITTPGVAFLTKERGFDAGIVISASHNPFYDNGIKIFSPSGKKIDGETEREIEKEILENRGAVMTTLPGIDHSWTASFQDIYIAYLAGEFEDLSLGGLKMVIDCANGAASALAPKLFDRFGAELIVVNCEPNGTNINENCGSLFIENLQEKVVDEGADFGVAFDGDADRALFSDEKGNLIDGDAILWIMSRHLRKHGKLANGKVVATVMSNIGLESALKSENIELLRTSVGDKYVLDELLKTGSAIGGEQSGHIIFPARSLVGDGMLTALSLLEAIRENGKPLSELAEGFTRFPQILVNIRVKQKTPFDEVPNIADVSAQVEKELGGAGRLLLRYSGTENLARVMIEGKDQSEIHGQAQRLADVIERALG